MLQRWPLSFCQWRAICPAALGKQMSSTTTPLASVAHHQYKRFHLSSASVLFTNKFPTKEELVRSIKASGSDVVSVWRGMNPYQISQAIGRSVNDVFEALNYIPEAAEKIDSTRTPIQDTAVITDVLRRLGRRGRIIAAPEVVEGIPSSHHIETPHDHVVSKGPLVPRSPVVAIMGHVDHGKTTLLDALRRSHIVDGEFGGITQHIGAFKVKVTDKETITFLDTPGHAAFHSLRSRGASVTDIVILVIAADDGIMEQTVESLKMAREAGVPVVVALNKVDKPGVDVDLVEKQILAVLNLELERFGGDVQCIHISALQEKNLDSLVQAVLVQAELLQLRGVREAPVEGVVIESRTHPARGKMVSALIRQGIVKKGTILVADDAHCKVRAMFDENGATLTTASLSDAIEIMGWRELPHAGAEIYQVETEKEAGEIVRRVAKAKLEEKAEKDLPSILKKQEYHLSTYLAAREQRRATRSRWRRPEPGIIQKEEIPKPDGPSLSIIIKGDVDGSVEAILDVLDTYHSSQCHLSLIHYGVGQVTPTDLEYAALFGGVIYTFNLKTPNSTKVAAVTQRVSVKEHNVIYHLIDDIRKEINARLPLVDVEHVVGEATVIEEFRINEKRKKVTVAGCSCTKGSLKRHGKYRVEREGEVLYDGDLASMKHLKSEVETVRSGVECGLRFTDHLLRFQRGDKIICYEMIPSPQKTDWNPGF
ncbi:unnamed protein product [Cyprideis torosa]|uniref:Translation initiation factor IF-2, mitochondrial n=1 Tax=Cyprideis torosa TaxID=163714 RepID=A0A7R8W5R0_9CRUS|nr:unnamed protein product [Cyprideis torosa]CAG0881146.1 unnamed protein product [Cyprideis torosa]